LRLNQETCAPHLYVHGTNCTRRHPTSRSSDHRVPDLCNHPQFSTSGLLLLPRFSSLHAIPHLPPAYHETSKHDSPNEQNKGKTNKTVPNLNSNLVKSITHHKQIKELTTWFLIAVAESQVDVQDGQMRCSTGRDLVEYDYVSVGKEGFITISMKPMISMT
jgi:hypothetical protein